MMFTIFFLIQLLFLYIAVISLNKSCFVALSAPASPTPTERLLICFVHTLHRHAYVKLLWYGLMFPCINRYTVRERVMNKNPKLGNHLTHSGYVNAQPIWFVAPVPSTVYFQFNSILFKDGAYFCYCAYVLRISRY